MDNSAPPYLDYDIYHNSTSAKHTACYRVEDAGDERIIVEMAIPQPLLLCDNGRWLVPETGELLEPCSLKRNDRQGCKPVSDGPRSVANLRRTMGRMQGLLCANFECEEKTWFITLTFANQVYELREAHRLMSAFWKRFRRTSEAARLARYLCIPEPHASGAWHLHLIVFFEVEMPEPCAEEIGACWGYGSVRAKRVYDAYGLGCYLNPLVSKRKEGRLGFYPVNKQLVWHSKNMKQPAVRFYAKTDCDLAGLLEGYQLRKQYPLRSPDGRLVGTCTKATRKETR